MPTPLFCDNETNAPRLFGSAPVTDYPKDGINDHVVSGAPTVNPGLTGTKAAWWYRADSPGTRIRGVAAAAVPVGRRGTRRPVDGLRKRLVTTAAFETTVGQRERDADEFYATIAPADIDAERMRVLRQSCAGLIWTKQIYPYRVNRWLDGDPGQIPPPAGAPRRAERRVAAPGRRST